MIFLHMDCELLIDAAEDLAADPAYTKLKLEEGPSGT